MRQHVYAGDIHRAKRRAPGAADRGSRDGVDLFDRVLAAGQRAKRQDHTMEPEVIGDEVRRVFRNDDAFAQPVIRELPDGLDDRRIRVRCRNQLEQMQIAGRVEEVRAEPRSAKLGRPAFRKGGNRDSRCVGADDRVRSPVLLDASEERALDVETLHDRFDHPVRAGDRGEILVEAPGAHQRVRAPGEQRIGFQRPALLEPSARLIARDVEQQHRYACIREVRGDLRPHGAGAEH